MDEESSHLLKSNCLEIINFGSINLSFLFVFLKCSTEGKKILKRREKPLVKHKRLHHTDNTRVDLILALYMQNTIFIKLKSKLKIIIRTFKLHWAHKGFMKKLSFHKTIFYIYIYIIPNETQVTRLYNLFTGFWKSWWVVACTYVFVY